MLLVPERGETGPRHYLALTRWFVHCAGGQQDLLHVFMTGGETQRRLPYLR
jgi:hypothetical protein